MGDWTDRYGSGIAKALGGRIPFSLGSRDEIIETQSDIGNQIAYKPNSNKDKYLKSLFDMKSTYGETPAYRQELQKDWDNHIKTGEPLSLPKKEYSGVKGFTSLNNLGDNRYVHADNIKTDGIYTDSSNKGIESFLNIDNPLPYNELEEKPFSENYNYDKANFVGIDNIDPQHLNIDTMHWDEKDRQNAIHNNALNVMKQGYEGPSLLERHNAAQREYNRVAPGANVTPWGDSGNITSAAVQGRRNEDWMNSLIGNYTMGIGKQDVKQNLINKYGTVQQQQNFADAIARKTHNPYANYDYFEGQGVDRADITADVTGMYTDSGSSGMDDIGDVTAPTDSWSDTGGTNVSGFSDNDSWGGYIARGGMVKDAPRYRYAEGGIVNLLPTGAW